MAQGTPQHTSMSEIARLKWRCRRGMKELDVLLERYVVNHYAQAPASQQAAFRELMEMSTPVMLALLLGREPAKTLELQQLVSDLQGPGEDSQATAAGKSGVCPE